MHKILAHSAIVGMLLAAAPTNAQEQTASFIRCTEVPLRDDSEPRRYWGGDYLLEAFDDVVMPGDPPSVILRINGSDAQFWIPARGEWGTGFCDTGSDREGRCIMEVTTNFVRLGHENGVGSQTQLSINRLTGVMSILVRAEYLDNPRWHRVSSSGQCDVVADPAAALPQRRF